MTSTDDNMPANGSKLSVLLVEDEALIRMMIAEMLEDLGHRVVAETSRIDEALKLAEAAKFDLALLDVNVAGSSILPVADVIERRGLPVLFVTGYATTGLPEPFGSRCVLHKPFEAHRLQKAIDAVGMARRR